MKMSFFWALMTAVNAATLIDDIITNDYSLGTLVTVAALLLGAYLYWDARNNERREAEEKKQFFNIIINHMGGEPEDVAAKRAADHLKRLL